MKNKNKNDSYYQNYPAITGYVLETITGYVLDDVTLNVREFPSTDAKIINKLSGGSEVTIDARTKDEEFLKINSENRKGYVLAKYVSIAE